MMTREEAIASYEKLYAYMVGDDDAVELDYGEFMELNHYIRSALRPVSREQVEKLWKSEWIDNGERDPNGVPKTFAISCKRCGSSAGTSWMRFCPACGAPMTDEAVDILLKRLEALYETAE